jgi:hypothetical protein
MAAAMLAPSFPKPTNENLGVKDCASVMMAFSLFCPTASLSGKIREAAVISPPLRPNSGC